MGSYSPPPGIPRNPPEFLPPEHPAGRGGDLTQEEELRAVRDRLPGARPDGRSRRGWAFAPATYTLLAINCAVFLVMVLNRVSITNPTVEQLLHWGANYGDAVLFYGQWWRVITAMFVHVGILHLATNMWCLWNLGLLGEPLIGPLGVLAAYLLSGAAGNLLSIGWHEWHGNDSVGAGASGAVFGLAGLLIILLRSPRLPIPPRELSGLRRYVMYFAVINFVIGFGGNQFFSSVQVDNFAHLGGCLGGMVFALPMVPLPGSPRKLFLMRRRLAVGLLTSLLIFFAYYLSVVFPASQAPGR